MKTTLVCTLLLFVVGCADRSFKVADKISKDVSTEGSCENFSEKMTTTLVQSLLDEEELPDEATLRKSLSTQLGSGRDALIEKTVGLYRLMTEETKQRLGLVNRDELIAAITALDIGDETTPEKLKLKNELRASFATFKEQADKDGIECAPPTPEEPKDEVPVKPRENLAAEGAQRVLMTAYQSCAASRLPAMDRSTRSVASGAIKVTGRHSSGGGNKREIANLALVQSSHYYVREGIEKNASCFNVTKSPLIYDYGGKPYSTTAVDSSLDLFKNAGSGTKVLGIDCSGFVFSALASMGLRVDPKKRAQAYLVQGINARMYMEPKRNGLSCLSPVPSVKDGSLRDGDILASSGHIIMVDSVGSDPFGIAGIKSLSGCISANMSASRFNFDVMHSAPIKGAIGINRIRASAYLGDSGSMRTAMLQYAVAACKANFGVPSTPLPSTARLVRHKLTPECMDRPVQLANASCVATCDRILP